MSDEAYDILQEISDKYSLNLDDSAMLSLACQYIDNQGASDAFYDYVVEAMIAVSDVEEDEDE